MKLCDKRILVVGGGSGIGFAVARAVLAEGAAVTLASTNPERLKQAAERLAPVEFACLDIADESAVEAFFASSEEFDHIVTTAGDWGTARRAAVEDLDLAAAKSLFQVRFWGAVTLAKHGAKRIAPNGSLTLTGGMSAHRPQKGSVIATAMAGSVEHLVLGLAVELAPIRVNAVCPGAIRTEVWTQFPESQQEKEYARIRQQLLPRIGEPEEAAEAYLYLMRGGYTTGQIIRVEGGSELAG